MGWGGGGVGGSKKTGCSSTFQTSVTVYWRHQLPVASFDATCTATDVRTKKKKTSPLPAGFEGRTCLTSVLGPRVSPQLSCVALIPSQLWASFQPLSPSVPRDPTSFISYTAPNRSCGRRGLRAGDHVAKRWMARSAPLSPLIVKY